MKSWYVVFVATHFFYISSLLFSMDRSSERCILTVAVFDHDTAAIGTNQNCVLVTNFSKLEKSQIATIIHKFPTQNLIVDKKNQRLGVFSEKFFVVYDIKTKNRIWSQSIHSDNCSAAFCHVDDTIFLCDNGQLTSNKNISMELPHTRNNIYFGIECHPKRKELLYPYSNRTLATYSFEDKTNKQYHPKIMKTDTILRAFYAPEGDDIAILTDTHKIFIYNPTNKSIVSVQQKDGSDYNRCMNPIFIPSSTILAFLCDGCKKIHYWDIKTKQTVISVYHAYDFSIKSSNVLINRFDCSLDGSYMLSTGEKMARGNGTHSAIMTLIADRKLFLCYCLLKIYSNNNGEFLLSDIFRLLIKQLRILLIQEEAS